jgi:hypothetical protein
MIKIHALDGYKYLGYDPTDLSENPDDIRDNCTYICLTFTDWLLDKEMILFTLTAHWTSFGSGIEAPDLIEAIEKWVHNNRTSRLHIVFWQHTYETQEALEFHIGKKPVVKLLGQKPEDAIKYINSKKAFFDNDGGAVEYLKNKNVTAYINAKKAYFEAMEARSMARQQRVLELRQEAEQARLIRAERKAAKAAKN